MDRNPFFVRRVRLNEQERFLIAITIAAAIGVALLAAALPGAAS